MPPSDNLQRFLLIIDALEKFRDHPRAHFNFSKLCRVLKILPKEEKELLNIIFHVQNLFHSLLEDYTIIEKRKNNTIYLELKPKSEIDEKTNKNEISINYEHANLLSDIIYFFQHIKIGKGFYLGKNSSKLIHNVKNLKLKHPYFFEHRGNGLIYLTKIAIDLGVPILAYKRANKPIKQISLSNYLIIIQEER
ncbi:MAG: hypothetical protein ACFFFB_09590 [Candidatus Heimdallarchaeota archaeon]